MTRTRGSVVGGSFAETGSGHAVGRMETIGRDHPSTVAACVIPKRRGASERRCLLGKTLLM